MMIANYMQLFNTKHTLIAGCLLLSSLAVSVQAADVHDVLKTGAKPIPLYPEIGPKTIDTFIFATSTKTAQSLLPIAPIPTLNSYVLNIFCTETTKTYIKAVSGSGVFLTDPRETQGAIITNAHVARHILDQSKKCVGRTGSPAVTTHRLKLRYIPSYWLNSNGQYIIGDPDQSSTGEFDFAVIETELIKPKKVATTVYDVLRQNLSLRFDNYDRLPLVGNTYIYSYPAQKSLSRNIYNPLTLKTDIVSVGEVYASPSTGERNSLLDVNGSSQIDHGSSGGMVVAVGTQNSLIGLSSILIKNNQPQVVRVVTIRHIFSTMEKDLVRINNAQTDSFLQIIQQSLRRQDNDFTTSAILRNYKFTSVLEKNTRDTLLNLGIISR